MPFFSILGLVITGGAGCVSRRGVLAGSGKFVAARAKVVKNKLASAIKMRGEVLKLLNLNCMGVILTHYDGQRIVKLF
jgi:hypothetical protein